MNALRTICGSIATLAIGVWVGGLLMLFVAVGTIFQTYDRTLAGRSTNAIFNKADDYHLIVAAVAILGVTVAARRSTLKWLTLGLLILAGIGAAVIWAYITPAINAMLEAGNTRTPEFRRLHGWSMGVYGLVTILTALATLLMPWVFARPIKAAA